MPDITAPGLDGERAWAWQRSWDAQQAAYMPDREERFAAILTAVDAVCPPGQPLRVMDLCGGTGSISLRLLRRRPDAAVTLVDLDPVLLHVAGRTLPPEVQVRQVDLRDPEWTGQVGSGFDAILTATALHWLSPVVLTRVYGEILGLLRPGGLFINADHMVDDGLPTVTEELRSADRRRRESLYATGAATSWDDWWSLVAADQVLGPLKAERDRRFGTDHSQEWLPPVSWHRQALLDAGLSEAGIVWRGGLDAAIAARRGT